jgi:hypothetical protein
MNYRFFIVPLILLFACGQQPGKKEALAYYEQLYKIAAQTKTKEGDMLREYNAYVDEISSSDPKRTDSLKANGLRDKNAALVQELAQSQLAVKALPEFDYDIDLRIEVSKVLALQEDYHRNHMSKLIDILDDGVQTKEEAVLYQNSVEAFDAMTSQYKKWKEIRKSFCEKFGITYDDIKALENKYSEAGEEN